MNFNGPRGPAQYTGPIMATVLYQSRRISDRIREDTIEIELHNRKDEAVEITAVEHLWGDWTITRTTDEFERTDAATAECTVRVPANSEKTISFTVRYQ